MGGFGVFVSYLYIIMKLHVQSIGRLVEMNEVYNCEAEVQLLPTLIRLKLATHSWLNGVGTLVSHTCACEQVKRLIASTLTH